MKHIEMWQLLGIIITSATIVTGVIIAVAHLDLKRREAHGEVDGWSEHQADYEGDSYNGWHHVKRY